MSHSDTVRLQFKSPWASALRRAARDEAGATLVEAALSILILFMMLFGIICLSMAMYTYHYLANTAHEATRYAIVHGGSWASTCDSNPGDGTGYGSNMCIASTKDIQNWVANRGFPGINITADDVCVEYFSSVPSSTSTSCTTSTGTLSNSPGDIVQVTITYPFTFAVPILGSYTYDLSSTSQMVIAQ